MVFRKSGKPEARPVRILRDLAATKPSRFAGAEHRDGWVLYRWATEFGKVVLAYPIDDHSMVFPDAGLLEKIAPDAAALVVVEVDYDILHGPNLEAVDAEVGKRYGTDWQRLEKVLGTPAPYWHHTMRHPELMAAWRPGAATLHIPAITRPDPAPLLRLAAEEADGSHAAAAALDTARRTIWSSAESCRKQLADYVDSSEHLAHIAVAARPLVPPEPPTVAKEILRDGWRSILNRTDTLAAECARLGQVLGGSEYFPGSCKVTVDPSSCAQAAQWASRLQPSPRIALATYLGDDRDQDILIDPVTDMPAVHTPGGKIETVAPQRLPAHSPLAALTIGNASVWVTTTDGTVFLAPQRGGGYTYGYGGGGPTSLARLIDLLLKDITHPAPGYEAERPPAGLDHATEEGWKDRRPPFTLTRAELEALRDG
ncbi:hypothetical protein EES37_37890 [Streptomyces sp. ADI91-18]|nr:hypothetical protein EES37_37890 [Streptomyces sp. ADI91-18]